MAEEQLQAVVEQEASQTEAKAKASVRTLRQIANRNLAVSLLLFAVLIGQIFFAMQRAQQALGEVQRLQTERVELVSFQGSLANVLLPLNDFTITRNPEDVPKIQKGRREFERLYREISQLPALAGKDRKALAQVRQLMGEVFKIAEDLTSGKIPMEQARNLAIVAQNLVFVAQRKLDSVAKSLGATLAEQVEERRAAIQLQSWIGLGLILLNVVVLVWLSRRFVQEVADQIGAVARRVSSAADEILRVVDQQAMVSELQAKSITQVSEELRELSETAAKIAATSANVEKIAKATASSAERGVDAVRRSIAAMDEIRAEVREIAEKVTESGQRVQQILEAIEQVREIADETHLLALNASIESAAAGEFGKRFAVVANEVRRLADRTTEFTEQIEAVIEQVREASQASVQAAEEGLREVEKSVQVAEQAGEVLERMREMSERTEKAVHTIARATQRQDEANRGFLETMEQIRGLIEDSARQMQISREAAVRLNEQAAELARLVGEEPAKGQEKS